jgi:hypothetical protein
LAAGEMRFRRAAVAWYEVQLLWVGALAWW